MNKKLALEILQLLSAVDAMLMQKPDNRVTCPEHVWESMAKACEELQKIVLGGDSE